jgi:undecaprenyl-diphosphatase
MPEIIILSIVQGITEFLPVSSSAHLIIISKYFNFSNENLTLDISLHLGSLLAIIIYFKKDLFDFTNNKNLFFKILISSIPVIFFGFLLVKLDLLDYLRSYKVIGWSTVIFGILLYLSDLIKVKKSLAINFTYGSALYIGILQILSLIPGVSRSGITITAGRFLNFSRIDSTKISFLISIPTLCAVSLYNIFNLFLISDFNVSALNLTATIFSLIFSYLTIKYFFYFLKRFNLTIFVIYRIILGIIILFYSYS